MKDNEDIKIESKITIKIKETKISLTIEETRKLISALQGVVGYTQYLSPYYPFQTIGVNGTGGTLYGNAAVTAATDPSTQGFATNTTSSLFSVEKEQTQEN